MVKFISSDKSKSCLVIPTKQISGSPHNGSTLTCLTNVIICGNSYNRMLPMPLAQGNYCQIEFLLN